MRSVLPKALVMLDPSRNTIVQTAAQTFFGERLIVQLPEAVSTSIFRYGFFDEVTSRALVRLLRPGSVFVDVGAHMGYFTTLAAAIVGSEGRVHAFEPNPLTRAVLLQNVSFAGAVVVDVRAVGATGGTLTLQVPPPSFAGYATADQPRIAGRQASAAAGRWVPVTVDCVPLDEVFADQHIDVVKIDVENLEFEVLEGASELIERTSPNVVLELGDEGGEPGRSAALLDWFAARGYSAHDVTPSGFKRHRRRTAYTYSNVVLRPDSRPKP